MKKIKLLKSGEKQEFVELEVEKSLVIIGSNGSGKTRFGLEIEKEYGSSLCKRICTQKNTQMQDSFSSSVSPEDNQRKFLEENNFIPPSDFQDDMHQTFSTLFSQRYIAINDILKEKERKIILEKVEKIWNSLFFNRKIVFELNSNKISFHREGAKFFAKELSDGERVSLYLISKILLLPPNYLCIIDEPELYLHKSLVGKLWDELEKSRNDCTFVYITHDLDFAISRTGNKIIYMKNYKDECWEWSEVDFNENIPRNLFLEILGSPKKILFIEGEKDSVDIQIYKEVYKDFTIFPVKDCKNVTSFVKNFKENRLTMDKDFFGLIDRDHREDFDLKKLKEDKIYSTPTRFVELVFLFPEIIEIVCGYLKKEKDYKKIIEMIFSKYEEESENISIISLKKPRISQFLKDKLYKIKNQEQLNLLPNELSSYINELESNFNQINISLSNGTLEEKVAKILEVYPKKRELRNEIEKILEIKPNFYLENIFNILQNNKEGEKLLKIFKDKLPKII